MSSLVRALENEQATHTKGSTRPHKGLTWMRFSVKFVLNFAGRDTTANTLAYSILLTAANPEVQDWVGEELQEGLQGSSSETWDYLQLYPRLKRCQAVLVSAPCFAKAPWALNRRNSVSLKPSACIHPS